MRGLRLLVYFEMRVTEMNLVDHDLTSICTRFILLEDGVVRDMVRNPSP